MPWTCSACSYSDNIDARTRCALCDAQKPAGVRAPAAPSGPKWACGFCTLENPGSAPSCMACGQPKPAAFQATRSAPPAQPIPASIAAAAAARPAAPAVAKPAATATTASKPAATPATAAKPTAAVPAASSAAKPTAAAAAPAASSAPKPAASTASAGPSEADIKFIESMGFTRAKAIQGLTAKKNDREQALDYLLSLDAEASKPKPAAPTASKPAAAATPATAAKPTAAAPAASAAAKPVAASTATAAKPAAAAAAAAAAPSAAANAVLQPLKQLTMDEKKALEQREAKRLELLKQMEEERAAKAKAKMAAAAPAASAAHPAKPAAKPSAAANVPRATSSSSSVPVSTSSVPVAVAKEEAPTKELSAEEKKLAKIAEERAAEAERKQIAALRLTKRLESEKKLKDIPSVCRTLQHNYDAIRYESMIVLLRKIIDKIVEDKGVNEKFRKINLNNPKIELNLSRPIGPIWILKQAGFEEIVEQPSSSSSMSDVDTFDGANEEERFLLLPAKKVDLAKLQSVSNALKQQLAVHSSTIPAIFNEIVSSNRYDLEAVYHLALELRLLVQNIIVSTDEVDQIREHMNQDASEADNAMSDSSSSSSSAARRAKADGLNKNFRTIDKQESFYANRIKPIKESRKILQELGFELDSHDLTKRFLVVPYERVSGEQNIKRYQVILREIQAFIRSIENSTPIAVALTHLCAKNRQKPTEKFIEIFSEAVRLVIANPHEQKFHKIVLNKVQNKIGAKPTQLIHGMEEFVKLFGFERRNDEVDPASALVSPATIRSLSDDNMTDVSPPAAASSSSSSAAGNGQTIRVALQYPGFDVEQLSWRSAELERVWNQLKEKAAAEQGKADGWSFE